MRTLALVVPLLLTTTPPGFTMPAVVVECSTVDPLTVTKKIVRTLF